MPTYRLAVPADVLLSVVAETEEAAKAAAGKLVGDACLVDGCDLPGFAADVYARLYVYP